MRGAKEHSPGSLILHYYPGQAQHSDKKLKRLQEGRKQGDKDDRERSGEGSAPNSGGDGNEGSKDCIRNSNSREKLGSGSGNNGNGNSATKQCQGSNQPNNESGMNGNGNSATKAVNVGGGNGNSGNDASTTSKVCACLRHHGAVLFALSAACTVTLLPRMRACLQCHCSEETSRQAEVMTVQEAAALRGTAEGGKRHVLADAEPAEPARPHASLERASDALRSRSTSLMPDRNPASANGEPRLPAVVLAVLCMPADQKRHPARGRLCVAQCGPMAFSGSAQDSKQNVPNGSSEPHGSSGQETGWAQGTSGQMTGEDSSMLLKAASLQGTADGAELAIALEPRECPCACA